MNPVNGLKYSRCITVQTSAATTAIEGFIDTLGCSHVFIVIHKSAANISLAWGVKHSTASGTAFASATAFSTAISGTLAAAAAADANVIEIDLTKTAHGRYLIVQITPSASTSTQVAVDAVLVSQTSPATQESYVTSTATFAPSQP